MRDPAGHALALEHGPYRAEVVGVGAGLRSLRHHGIDLIDGSGTDELRPQYRGWVLQPWPNRVGDGRYDHAGISHQLALTEPERGNALHGLVGWVHWEVHHPDASRAVLRHELVPQLGYPYVLDLGVEYRLREDGLHVTMTATNEGTRSAPYGAGHHPYLTLGRPADELELTLPASAWCEIDERGLPGPLQPVEGTPFDFREPRLIGDLAIDHPFGGLTSPTATLRDPDTGRAVSITLGDGCSWLHVFTADSHDPARQAVAIEPMTCPPDAFRTGTDLVVLEPGETHRASFTITGS